MNKKYFKDDAIFSYNGVDYTVADFYNDAKNAYGTSVLTEYFQLEYQIRLISLLHLQIVQFLIHDHVG